MTYLFPYAGQEKVKRPIQIFRPKPVQKNIPANPPRKIFFDDSPLEKLKTSAFQTPFELFNYDALAMPISFKRIMRDICIEHNVTPVDIMGIDSRTHVVQARRQYCIRARLTGASFAKIGISIKKDHTTVIHFVKQGMEGYPSAPVKQDRVRPSNHRPRKITVTELTEAQKEFVRLSEEENLSIPEIAIRMGKSKNAIKHIKANVAKKRALLAPNN